MSDHTNDVELAGAIDTMAAAVHHAAIEAAVEDNRFWDTWPEIGERDWNRITLAVGEFAFRPPQEDIDRAMDYLTKRAAVHKEDGR